MSNDNVYTVMTERLYRESPYLERILRKLMTPEEAEMLLALPATSAELSAKFGSNEETIKSKLKEFTERGLAIPSKGELRFAGDVARLHDATLSSAEKWVDTELLDLWREFYEKDWFTAMKEGPKSLTQPVIRVIPAWKAIERSPKISADDVLPQENIRELIRGAHTIAIVPCTCRRSMRRCHAPLDNCMQFNRGAEYSINRGAGRKLSVEEAIAIADEAEEVGLVHTWPFPPSFFEICNCCRDCCQLFDGGIYYGTLDRVMEKSRFRAEIDEGICTGCEDCVERCFFGAIEMVESGPDKSLKAALNPDKCFGCGLCAVRCTMGAVTMKLARP
jgi:NAD-dependent dihydropyrimidine dehydrogenase PreA subunit